MSESLRIWTDQTDRYFAALGNFQGPCEQNSEGAIACHVTKRKHLSLAIKLASALHALGLHGKAVAYDHRPPLSHRPFDPATGLYNPDELDPRYLFPVTAEENKRLADGDGSPLSGDTRIAAKLKRLVADQAAFRDRLLAKETGEDPAPKKPRWHSRPFSRNPK